MKEEFDLEHSIVESGIKGVEQFEVLELPLSNRVFWLLGLAVAGMVLAVLGRVFYLAAVRGEFYQTRSAMNSEQVITLPATRGLIYDRFGNVLAANESAYRLVLNIGLVKRSRIDLDDTLAQVSKLLYIEKSELLAAVQKADLEKTALVTLARNISSEEVKTIRQLEIPALEIQDDYRREDLRGPAFAHVLGYTGIAQYNDLRGKTGLEKYYDDLLGGEDGVRLMYRDAKRNILEEKLLETPRHGGPIYTAIDSGLQEYFYNRLAQALHFLGRDIGVGIALNPQNGEILALVNLPSYNNNIFTKSEYRQSRSAVLASNLQPLFNRAVSGIYTPGSAVKPLVALAALNEGLISSKERVFSSGVLEIPNPYFPDQPSRFLDWKAHGWVDLRSALARSSNIYFYAL